MSNNRNINTPGVLESILRQWAWADEMRQQFRLHFPPLPLRERISQEQPYWLYMSFWYALLYSILEALDEVKATPPEIKALLDTDLKNALRLYRNSVFHVQHEYWCGKKIMPLINTTNSVEKIHAIHNLCREFIEGKVKEISGEDISLKWAGGIGFTSSRPIYKLPNLV